VLKRVADFLYKVVMSLLCGRDSEQIAAYSRLDLDLKECIEMDLSTMKAMT
jgi:hypothetical protein